MRAPLPPRQHLISGEAAYYALQSLALRPTGTSNRSLCVDITFPKKYLCPVRAVGLFRRAAVRSGNGKAHKTRFQRPVCTTLKPRHHRRRRHIAGRDNLHSSCLAVNGHRLFLSACKAVFLAQSPRRPVSLHVYGDLRGISTCSLGQPVDGRGNDDRKGL